MTYDINITPLQLQNANYYQDISALSGAVLSPPPTLSAVNNPIPAGASAFFLQFPSPPVPSKGPSALLVTDPLGGDVIRSGFLAALPTTPPTPVVVTIAPITQSAADVAAQLPNLPSTRVPNGYRWLSGLLSGGVNIPLFVSLAPPTVTTTAAGLMITATGLVAIRQFFFFVRTVPLTLTLSFTWLPSADALNTARVLSLSVSAMSVNGGFPGIGALSPFFTNFVGGFLENKINQVIAAMAPPEAAKHGYYLTPFAVICAHRVLTFPDTVPGSATGATAADTGVLILQLVISGVTGLPVTPIPATLHIAISPSPKIGVQQDYRVTVTDNMTGTPIAASVTLVNNAGGGISTSVTQNTDPATGATLFRAVTLNDETISIGSGDGERPPKQEVVAVPTITATAVGYPTETVGIG